MQKTIVRNGLIALLFAFLMVLICMPQNASAITSCEDSDSLSGYIYSFVNDDTVADYNAISVKALYVHKGGDDVEKTYDLDKGQASVDLTAFVADAFAAKRTAESENNTINFTVRVTYENGANDYTNELEFIEVEAQATVQDTVTEDTTFEYGVKAVTFDTAENEYELAESEAASLAVNKITIKKGSSASEVTKLMLAILKRLMDPNYEDIYVIYEKPNNYGYNTSTEEVAVCANKTTWGKAESVSQLTYDYLRQNDLIARKAAPVVSLAGVGGSAGLVKEINAIIQAGRKTEDIQALASKLTLLNSKTDAKVATFSHTAKGVQTGDANDFALWIALFVMAAVAAGAVALKRN